MTNMFTVSIHHQPGVKDSDTEAQLLVTRSKDNAEVIIKWIVEMRAGYSVLEMKPAVENKNNRMEEGV